MKKILAIILVVVLLISLSACGEKNGWTDDGKINLTESSVLEIINGEFKTPKNIIFIIGDGMGVNDIETTEIYSEEKFPFGLVINQIKNQGLSTTASADSKITDSAASATALSTGVKTNNGFIGKDPQGNDLKTMAELARECGKKVGIITNEDINGATPSGFTVHSDSRDNRKEIINKFINFKPDVLMGVDYNSVFVALNDEERQMFENDYVVAKKFEDFETAAATDPEAQKPFIGFIEKYSSVASYNLAQSAKFAFDRLKNDNGFFVMIESAGTDKFGHNKDMNGKIASVVTLDRTVAAALLFMKENPDTLLVVTSDHETGGVRKPTGNEKYLSDLFTTGSHTATKVKVFAVGKGSEYFNGETVDNTDIAKFLIDAIKGN
ncbi:MAG: alkaline phosphatase [Clostridia bacterium]|nr:alkaline phosphatase [Clostridia bacterium]